MNFGLKTVCTFSIWENVSLIRDTIYAMSSR